MKYIALTFALLFSGLANAADATIYFPYQPRWNLNGYLLHLIMKVPLDQYAVSSDGRTIYFSGRLWLQVDGLPDKVRPAVEEAVREALAGKREISGARIDASQAHIFFSHEQHPGLVHSEVPEMSVAILDRHYLAESGVMGPEKPPGPAPQDSVEQLERLHRAEQQSDFLPFHCQMLLETIPH